MPCKASRRHVKIPANVHKQTHRAVAPRNARQSMPDVTVDSMKSAPNGREEGAEEPDATDGGIRCNLTYSTHSCKFLLLFMTPLNQAGHKLSKNYKLAADGT